MAMAILAPAKWSAFPKAQVALLKESTSKTSKTYKNLVQKRLEEEALRIAEETGYFVTVTRELIVSRYVNCSLPQYASKRNEAIEKALTRIKVISLCGLHVRELLDIGICTNLRVLDLSNNFLGKVDPVIHCRQLVKLDLHGNQLSSLPGEEFWTEMKKLQILFLHDNPLSGYRSVDRLASCANLNVLTLYDSPLSLRVHCRHHVVNTIWSLRSLDRYVISDEEIVDGANFGGRFTARSLPFQIEPCSSNRAGDELSMTWQLLRQVNSVVAHHSAVVIIQRYVRGHLVRRALAVISGTNVRWKTLSDAKRNHRVWNIVLPRSAISAIRPPPSTPVVHTERPLTVNSSGTELIKLDYDTYMRIRRPGSATDISELGPPITEHTHLMESVPSNMEPSAASSTQRPDVRTVNHGPLMIDIAKLQSSVKTQEDDDTSVICRGPQSTQSLAGAHRTETAHGKVKAKIRTAQDLLNLTVVGREDDEDETQTTVAFRLRGFVPPVIGQSAPTVAAAERTRFVDSIREMNYSCHPSSTTSDAVTRQSTGDGINNSRVVAVNRRPVSKGSGVWLACLNAVSADYRRAEMEDQIAEKRALVRQRREERDRALETASDELERQKSWTNFVEQTERRAISAALDSRAELERRTAVSYREARRRSITVVSNRRRDVKFANDVMRRVSACARANERFVESEWRNTRAVRATESVSGWHDDEVARRNDASRASEMRRVARQLRVEAEKTQLEATLSNQSLSRMLNVKDRVLSLKQVRAAASAEPKQVISLPLISSPD